MTRWLALALALVPAWASGSSPPVLRIGERELQLQLRSEPPPLPEAFERDPRSLASCKEEAGNDRNECVPGVDCVVCGFNRCWAREGATFVDDANCDPTNPTAAECPDLTEPNPSACPADTSLTWTVPEQQVSQGDAFSVTATLDLGPLFPKLVQAPCGAVPNEQGNIPHANVHGCVQQLTSWWCGELVPAYQPPLVTASPGLCLNVSQTSSQAFTMQIDASSPEPPNRWLLYAHYYFFTDDGAGGGNLTKRHFTVGASFSVQGQKLAPKDESLYLVYGFSALAILFIVACTSLLVYWRDHWVIIAASYHMCLLMCVGAMIGMIAVFTFIPNFLNDGMCIARQWLTPLALDLLITPLVLKTWRIYRIFSNTKMKKVKITDKFLALFVLGILVVEIIYNTIWTLVSPLGAGKSFSKLDQNAFEVGCVSDNMTAQKVFTTLTIVLHAIPLFILCYYAYHVRLSFKYATYNKRHAEFDESLFIMLATLNICVAGLFVIIFQETISGNPNSTMCMQTLGIIWIILMTLGLIFGPKFHRIAVEPSEKPEQLNSESFSSDSLNKKRNGSRSGTDEEQRRLSGAIGGLQDEQRSSKPPTPVSLKLSII